MNTTNLEKLSEKTGVTIMIKISPSESPEEMKRRVNQLTEDVSKSIYELKNKYSTGVCNLDKAVDEFRNAARKLGAAEAMLDIMAYRGKDTGFVSQKRDVLKEKEREMRGTIKKAAENCGYGGKVYREKDYSREVLYSPKKKSKSKKR